MDAEPDFAPRRPDPVSWIIAVAWLAWLAAIPVYGASIVATWAFFGESASAADESRQLWLALLAAGLSLVPSLVALGCSVQARRPVAAGLLLVAVVLALVPAGLLGAEQLRERAAQTPPPTDRPGCVELSGGDNDCPGG